jgi:hypothetical protein
MIRGAARRDDADGQRRYVRAAGDPDTEDEAGQETYSDVAVPFNGQARG